MVSDERVERGARALARMTAEAAGGKSPAEYAEANWRLYSGQASAVLLAMDEWQPIWMAPKDGRAILIWQPDKAYMNMGGIDDNRYAIGYWRDRGGWGNRNSADVTPTHWMPLPEPPK